MKRRPIAQEPIAWWLGSYLLGLFAARTITLAGHRGHKVAGTGSTVFHTKDDEDLDVHHGDWALMVLIAATIAVFVFGRRRSVAAVSGLAHGVFFDEWAHVARKKVAPEDYFRLENLWASAIVALAGAAGVAWTRRRSRLQAALIAAFVAAGALAGFSWAAKRVHRKQR